jgi:hypothetical protein
LPVPRDHTRTDGQQKDREFEEQNRLQRELERADTTFCGALRASASMLANLVEMIRCSASSVL